MKNYSYLLIALFSSQVFSAPIIITVGTDINCNFQSIQTAVDSGAINMDIRVTNQENISDGIEISDGDDVVSLSGGYNNCQDALIGVVDDNKPYTDIVNLNGDVVLSITKDVDLNANINVSRFKLHNGIGGAFIASSIGNESLTVNFNFVDLFFNTEAGIKIRGNGVEVNFDNGKVYDNIDINGGGFFCSADAVLNLGENVAIYNNLAELGGGIYASDCIVNIAAGDNNTLEALELGIFNNQALDLGAGIYLNKSILIGLGTQAHPVSISGNNTTSVHQFTGLGGGIYLSSGSSMTLVNVRLDGNSAAVAGGAIATVHNDLTLDVPSFFIFRNENGCDYSEICSSLSNNRISENGNGSVTYQQNGGFGYIVQALVKGNGSQNSDSLFHVKSGSKLYMFSDLVVSNISSQHLIDQKDVSEVIVQYSTFSDNQISNYFNVQYDNNNPQVLEVIGTIIKNAGATIANLNNDNGNHDAQVKCSLVENDDASGVVQNLSVIGNPGFIGNNNYKLQPSSLAINRSCSNIGEFDLARYDVRNQDHNADGVADLGAYENIAEDDVIFNNSFQGGL